MAGVAELFGFTGISATLFSISAGLGAWVDKEAEASWNSDMRQSLKAATWFTLFEQINRSFSHLLDRIFGEKLFGWRGVWISAIITASATLIIIVITSVLLFVLGYNNNDTLGVGDFLSFLYLAFVVSVIRLPATLVIDYLTLVRVRFLCRRTRGLWLGTAVLFLSIVLDAVTLFMILVLGAASWTCMASGCSEFTISQVIEEIGMFKDLPKMFSGPMIEAVFIPVYILLSITNSLASIVPSLVFYIFFAASLFLNLLQRALSPIAAISKHLMFTKPFTAIGIAAGVLVAGITSGILSLFHSAG